jgi:ABC-type dipeptide/oligopeptide/nickel transport system ATPase component
LSVLVGLLASEHAARAQTCKVCADLGVVEHMSDRVAVMYLGRIVENGDWREMF